MSGLRQALLQRLADRLAIAREYHLNGDRDLPECCWVHYDQHPEGRTEHWVHRLCTQGCPHWHHRIEVFLA